MEIRELCDMSSDWIHGDVKFSDVWHGFGLNLNIGDRPGICPNIESHSLVYIGTTSFAHWYEVIPESFRNRDNLHMIPTPNLAIAVI